MGQLVGNQNYVNRINFTNVTVGLHILLINNQPSKLLRKKCPNTDFFLVRIFLYSDWTRIYSVNLRIQSEYRKIRTRKKSVSGHFLRSVIRIVTYKKFQKLTFKKCERFLVSCYQRKSLINIKSITYWFLMKSTAYLKIDIYDIVFNIYIYSNL